MNSELGGLMYRTTHELDSYLASGAYVPYNP